VDYLRQGLRACAHPQPPDNPSVRAGGGVGRPPGNRALRPNAFNAVGVKSFPPFNAIPEGKVRVAKLTLLLGPMAKVFCEAVDRLEDLPNDPDEIYQLFKALEIKGEVRSSENCALTQFIKGGIGKFNEDVLINTVHDAVFFEHGPVSLTYDLPTNVKAFVKAFDKRQYPDILLPPSDHEEGEVI
jgi:hypothetical protein